MNRPYSLSRCKFNTYQARCDVHTQHLYKPRSLVYVIAIQIRALEMMDK